MMANMTQVKNQVATRQVRPMSPAVAEIRTNINLMVETMKSVMKDKVHYGVIPGVDKPSLFKAGAEKIMATFRLSAFPKVTDLSGDGEIRFRVEVEIKAKDGTSIGAGIGECSSGEEKYSWRAAICEREFEVTQQTHRRIKFKKDKFAKDGFVEIKQVRCSPSDMANTILKMAKKRALIDGVLTATGASDIFAQDLEDLPEEYVKTEIARQEPTPTAEPTPQPEPQAQESKPVDAEVVDVSLSSASVGAVVPAFRGMVTGVKVRDVKGKDGNPKQITAYRAEDTQGASFVIEKWGGVHEGVEEGVLVTFQSVKVGEYKGERQYLAQEIMVG